MVDAYSKWVEAFVMQSTDTKSTIEKLVDTFARFGLPKWIHTDNGPQLASKEFKEFIKENGIKHTFSPPYHPASNGAAENIVKTFKRSVTRNILSGMKATDAARVFLFDYRRTPHTVTGVSPASLMFKREIRSKLDLLKPSVDERVSEKNSKVCERWRARRETEICENDVVMVKMYRNNKEKWERGKIYQKLSPVMYIVETAVGKCKRHIDQIVKCDVKHQIVDAESIKGNKPVLQRSARLLSK